VRGGIILQVLKVNRVTLGVFDLKEIRKIPKQGLNSFKIILVEKMGVGGGNNENQPSKVGGSKANVLRVG